LYSPTHNLKKDLQNNNMQTLQQILDDYGAFVGCKDWDGYIRECKQQTSRADKITGKFNELLMVFKTQFEQQEALALKELKVKIYPDQKQWTWTRDSGFKWVLREVKEEPVTKNEDDGPWNWRKLPGE